MKGNHQNQIILYMHAGSGNHGCEAIVNSLCHMMKEDTVLVSYRGNEDWQYTLKELCEIKQERSFEEHRLAHIAYYAYRMITKDAASFLRYRYGDIFKQPMSPLAISIGGDNYCYDSMLSDLRLANLAFTKKGTKTVLLGCSIEPELLKREQETQSNPILEDLSRYHLIIARESLTYVALCDAFEKRQEQSNGNNNSNNNSNNNNNRNILNIRSTSNIQITPDFPRVVQIPDPAFTLGYVRKKVPDGFWKGNTVGVNVSPLIQKSESVPGITMKCYEELIEWIIEHTDMQIALIPHVVWKNNDDRKPLSGLYEKYKSTERLVQITDGSCEELKGYISQCRFFVGARTHATIAAYSTCVPTLVVGYSVKAAGIAQDLFGSQEHYVLPVQSLKDPQDLVQGFQWLMEQEDSIREHLQRKIPDYQRQALQTGEEINHLWEELKQQQETSYSDTSAT
jgi:colanic acid/amylovoran biosynthesis protein